MNFHKKIIVNSETVFDITSDTVQPSKVLEGESFHDGEGVAQEGTIKTYSGDLIITENQTLATAGKYMADDIEVNVDIPIVDTLPAVTADSPNVVIMNDRLYLKK